MTTKTPLFILLITAATSVSIFAQPRPSPSPTPARPATPQTPANPTMAVPASKIAVIDTEAFADEKAGIVRLVDAIKIVQNEFRARQQELQTLQARINTLVEDIRKLRQASGVIDQKTIQAKQEEGTRVQQDLQTKQQRFDEDYSKRYGEVTGPISQQIGKALDEFALQHGITMTLDLSKMLPAILTALPTVEVTGAFIADFNRKNPRTLPTTRP